MTTQKRFERPPRTPARPTPPSTNGDAPPRAAGSPASDAVVPAARDALEAGGHSAQTDGGLRVHKTVHERETVVDPPLARDDVQVERVQVNRSVDGPVDVRYEGDTMIIPVLEEVLVVHKRLVLKEEIRVTRRRSETHAPQRVRLRSEQAVIERQDAGAGVAPADDGRDATPLRRGRTPPSADTSQANPAAAAAVDDGSLIERKRRQMEMRRGRLAKTLLPY